MVRFSQGRGRARRAFVASAILLLSFCSARAATSGRFVRFETILGDFDVQLFPEAAPKTVDNFLTYVDGGSYDESFFHRLASSFVLQGGGFGLFPDQEASIYPVTDGTETKWIGEIPSGEHVDNEYGIENTRGTIAMAKKGGDPDSATNQFFFNLTDNSDTLGPHNNGGFTVFGTVIGRGMEVVDALASQTAYNAGAVHGAFSELPLIEYAGGPLARENLEMMTSVRVVEPVPGDANIDGAIDIVDLTAFAVDYEADEGVNWSRGDFNFDGVVNNADFGLLADNWTFPPAESGGVAPEPGTLFLLAFGAAGLLRARPRR